MAAHLDDVPVKHNHAAQQFELEFNGYTGLLAYRRAPGKISLDHTFVPAPIEGQGAAAKLTRAALDFARAEKLRVVPACSYVAAFVSEHAEYQDLVAK